MPREKYKNICVSNLVYQKAREYVEKTDRHKSIKAFTEKAIETAIEGGI